MRRPLILAIALVALASQPALAGSPGGACGATFTRATFEEIQAIRPALPAEVFNQVDMNGNDEICYLELKAPDSPNPNSGHLNLVDDSGPAR
jgi:hypothetical protein